MRSVRNFMSISIYSLIIFFHLGQYTFKLGTYALWPFGKELVDGPTQPGCLSIVTQAS